MHNTDAGRARGARGDPPDDGRHGRGSATLAVLLAVLVAATALLATPAQAERALTRYDDPDIVPTVGGSDVLTPGETRTVDVQLQNRGGSIGEFSGAPGIRGPAGTTSPPGAAIATTVEVAAGDAPVDVRTGEQAAGTITPQGMATAPVTVEVDDDASPGTYRLPVSVTYDYLQLTLVEPTATDTSYSTIRDTATARGHVTVRVEPHVDPAVRTVASDLSVGADGTVTVAVTNDGDETASDAELVLQSAGSIAAEDASTHVGTLGPGDRATASYRVSVDDGATAGAHGLTYVLSYDDEDDDRRTSRPVTAAADVGPEAAVDVTVEPVDLYVDSVGGVRVNVTNTGDDTLRAATLVVRESPPLLPVSSRTALGDLAPGETVETGFRVEVSDRAVAGDEPLDLAVRYRNSYDDPEETGEVTASVPVGPERGFAVAGEPPSVSAGATETVTFRLRNTGASTLDDAVARINADSPFSTDDDTAYLGDLAPGETANATFRVSVDGGATPKTYSMDAEIKFQNGYGDRVVTDLEEAPVRVEESGGLIAGLLSAIAGLLP